jgi:hypothetical protein
MTKFVNVVEREGFTGDNQRLVVGGDSTIVKEKFTIVINNLLKVVKE